MKKFKKVLERSKGLSRNQKILTGVALLLVIVFGVTSRGPSLNDLTPPPGYSAPKSIAAIKLEEEKAYAKAMADLEKEEKAKLAAEAVKAKPVSVAAVVYGPFEKISKIPLVKSVSNMVKTFASRHNKKAARNVAFKSGHSKRRKAIAHTS